MFALYNFDAELENELSIYPGEPLELVDSCNDFTGWTMVRNSRGQVGIVPSTYIGNEYNDLTSDGTVEIGIEEESYDNVSKVISRCIDPCIYKLKIHQFHNLKVARKSKQTQIDNNGKSIWKPKSQPYSIFIIGHHSAKKYHGLKSFVTYDIQTEKFDLIIKRRYNQFLWLHGRLEDRYPNLCIPLLPEKSVTGNFKEEFIQKRQNQLELWLNQLTSHPVLRDSEALIHFLQSDENKWKTGKRKAEKDELIGAQWMNTIDAPLEGIGSFVSTSEHIDKFTISANNLEGRIKEVTSSLERIESCHNSSCSKEMSSLGKGFEQLGLALSDESMAVENDSMIANAFLTTGNVYTQIGNQYCDQSNLDTVPLLDRFNLYRRILQRVNTIVQYEKNSMQVYDDLQMRSDKLVGVDLADIVKRKDLVSHVTFAEINQINMQKNVDLTVYMRVFLKEQVKFYREVTECLERALNCFEQIPVERKSEN